MNNKDLFKDANQRATTHCRHRTQTPPTATAEATTGREGQAIISKAIGEGRENMTELEAFYPALTLTRPISTMHTAKTQIVRQPQRNRCLLRAHSLLLAIQARRNSFVTALGIITRMNTPLQSHGL